MMVSLVAPAVMMVSLLIAPTSPAVLPGHVSTQTLLPYINESSSSDDRPEQLQEGEDFTGPPPPPRLAAGRWSFSGPRQA